MAFFFSLGFRCFLIHTVYIYCTSCVGTTARSSLALFLSSPRANGQSIPVAKAATSSIYPHCIAIYKLPSESSICLDIHIFIRTMVGIYTACGTVSSKARLCFIAFIKKSSPPRATLKRKRRRRRRRKSRFCCEFDFLFSW